MAKKKDETTVNISVNPDDLGVLSKHDLLMQTDQEYRDEALTPPGGKAPGEGDKPADPIPDDPILPAGAIAAGVATEARGAQS
jgi:hypothetical protein